MMTVAQTVAEPTRRDFLFIATGAVGAVGVASAIWPFISQMAPDAATIAAGAPVEIDLGPIRRGRPDREDLSGAASPIFVRNRTEAEVKEAQDVDVPTCAIRSPTRRASRKATPSG
jgi:ubiquinol-cytochrome c reductase iron-sulfur subunit